MGIGSIVGSIFGGVGGSIGAGSNNSTAINQATDATLQANRENAALYRDIYSQNKQTLAPYVAAGLPATNTINALLGLGGTAATPGQADYSAYVRANPDLMADFQKVSGKFGGDINAYGQYHYNTYGQNEGRSLPMTGGTPGVSAADATQAAQQAFDQFRNSTGYDFRVKQGMNAVNSGYAGAGTIKSGAAIKGAIDYGQGMASEEFGNYLNALGTQQGVGLKAAGAQAGVSTDYANSLGAVNASTANALAQAAVAKANNSNATMNGILRSISRGIGAF